MKLLAEVEDDLQPVYQWLRGLVKLVLVKVIKTAFDQGLELLLEKTPQVLFRTLSSC